MNKYIKQISAFRPALKWAITAEIFYQVGIGILTLLFNLHILQLGYDPSTIGSLLAAGFAVTAIMLIPIGRYADVIGRRLTFILGTIMVTAGMAIIGYFPQLAMLYVGEILYSLGSAVVLSTGLPIVLSLSQSKEEETFAYSIVTSMAIFAVGVGSILGGFLADWIPGNGSTLYRPALLIGTVLIVIALVIRYLLPVPPLKTEGGGQKPAIGWWPSKEVMKFIGYAGLVGLGFAFTIPFYNLMLELEYGLESRTIGIIIGSVQFVQFLGMFLVPYLERKLGRNTGFALFIFGGVTVNVVMGFLPNIWLFVALLFVYTFVYPVIVALVERHALSVTRDEERSQHVAYRSVFRFLAFLIGGKLGGVMIGAQWTSLNFYLTSIILLIILAYYFGVIRSVFADREKQQPDASATANA
ncbi:MAG: MFS transporter [Bacillaceae bacterium]|nr:MFS transporter [Bacillaceae bacterium]